MGRVRERHRAPVGLVLQAEPARNQEGEQLPGVEGPGGRVVPADAAAGRSLARHGARTADRPGGVLPHREIGLRCERGRQRAGQQEPAEQPTPASLPCRLPPLDEDPPERVEPPDEQRVEDDLRMVGPGERGERSPEKDGVKEVGPVEKQVERQDEEREQAERLELRRVPGHDIAGEVRRHRVEQRRGRRRDAGEGLPAEEGVRGEPGDGEEQHVPDAAIVPKRALKPRQGVERAARGVGEAAVGRHPGEGEGVPVGEPAELLLRLRAPGREGARGGGIGRRRLPSAEDHRAVEEQGDQDKRGHGGPPAVPAAGEGAFAPSLPLRSRPGP